LHHIAAAEEEWKSHRSSLEERCSQAESAAAKALKESIKDAATGILLWLH
jgi:hypothetical protein